MAGKHNDTVDFGICIFGVVGSLLFSGAFGAVSSTLLFFWGLFSLGIVLISAFFLVGSSLVKVLPRSERLIYALQLLTNIVPSVSLVVGYLGKTQIYTPPGCC